MAQSAHKLSCLCSEGIHYRQTYYYFGNKGNYLLQLNVHFLMFLESFLLFAQHVSDITASIVRSTLQPSAGYGLLVFRGFMITHNDAPQSVGFLWTSDQSIAETSTWQNTTHTTDKPPCPRWDSNPWSQHASGLRPRSHWVRLSSNITSVYYILYSSNIFIPSMIIFRPIIQNV
jgi:hypothetical protein